jgi:hypothetical protein
MKRGICLILCETSHIIAEHFDQILKALALHGVKNPSFPVAIDGTAMVPLLEYSTALWAMTGGVFLNHFIEVPENVEQGQLKSLLFDTKVDLAK